MAEGFYVTNKGLEAVNRAVAEGKKVLVNKAKFGSGGSVNFPQDLNLTDLRHPEYEKRLDPITDSYVVSESDPTLIMIRTIVPEEVECVINEIGYFDDNDNLIIYGLVQEEEKNQGIRYQYDNWIKFKNVENTAIEIYITSPDVERVEKLVQATKEDFDNRLADTENRLTTLQETTVNEYRTLKEETVKEYTELKDQTVKEYTELKDNAIKEYTELRDQTVEEYTNLKNQTVQEYTDLRDTTIVKYEELLSKMKSDVNVLVDNTTNNFNEIIERVEKEFNLENYPTKEFLSENYVNKSDLDDYVSNEYLTQNYSTKPDMEEYVQQKIDELDIDSKINIKIATSQPSEKKENMVWFDMTNHIIYVYNGSSWIPFGAVYQ